MTLYTHVEMEGIFGNAKFVLPDGRQFPRSFWRTASSQQISGLGFRVYEPTVEPEPEPSTDPTDYPLLPWQFKAMVIYLGKDTAIRTAIGQISDDLERAAALSRYENASAYVFDDPLLQQMRQAVGMSEEDLSAAWMLAKDLRSA